MQTLRVKFSKGVTASLKKGRRSHGRPQGKTGVCPHMEISIKNNKFLEKLKSVA